MAKKKKIEPPENHERWMVSYADFMTLLFATFTALFAISNADKTKFEQMAKSVKKAFADGAGSVMAPSVVSEGGANAGGPLVIKIFPEGAPETTRQAAAKKEEDDKEPPDDADPMDGVALFKGNEDQGQDPSAAESEAGATPTPTPTPAPTPLGPAGTPVGTEGTGNEVMANELQEALKDAGLQDMVEVRQEKRGTVISLGEAAFFELGSIDVMPQSKFQLSKIVNVLRDKHFDIRIEGHTDNTPVASGRFRSNFELSTMRATRILEFMVKEFGFSPEALSAAGYGEGRPIADNNTPDGRQKNRRVDIVILNQRGAAGEPEPGTPAETPAPTVP